MKTLLITFICFISVNAFSQNITNTLGTSGVFTIKDDSLNYLTLTQSTGDVNIFKSLRLENSTGSTIGIIFKGTQRFLHNSGTSNTFLGINSGNYTGGGRYNTGVGESSLFSNISGSNCTAVGLNSLSSNTTGNNNTALGHTALDDNTTGSNNTAVGTNSLGSNISGLHNTAVGFFSLPFNTSGDSNTAVGYNSLYFNTTGNNNIAFGNSTLRSNTTGNGNTALGINSLVDNTTGGLNTGLGYLSLSSNTTGILNTALGYSTGSSVTTGFNLTLVGYNAEPTSGSASNQVTLGNSTVASLRCNVQTITSLSDARDKKNIKDLSLGLDFIMKVKPRLFNWDKREWYKNNTSDGSKMNEFPTAGFIAQELDDVQTNEKAEWLNLVLKDNPEKFEATYGNLLPVMVKAIQELKVEGEKLKVESEKLKVENVELKENNEKLLSEIESLKLMNEKIVKLEKIVNELTSVKFTSLDSANENKTISKQGDEK